jgi:hypothetical protein
MAEDATLSDPARDLITAAFIDARRIAVKKGSRRAGIKHFLKAIAPRLWEACTPDVDKYTARLGILASLTLAKLGGSDRDLHPVDGQLLIDKYRAEALRDRAQQNGRNTVSRRKPRRAGRRGNPRMIQEEPPIDTAKGTSRVSAQDTGRPKSLLSIDGQKVKSVRGDLTQPEFLQVRGVRLSLDLLQQAETKDLATMKTLRKICALAKPRGIHLEPKDFLKNTPRKAE